MSIPAYRIGTHNVKNNPDIPREDVVRCGVLTRKNTDVCVFQEIGEAEDVVDLRKGLGDSWRLINESVSAPIGFNKNKFDLTPARRLPPGFQNRGVIKIHSGNAKIPTPPRYITWGILDTIGRPKIPPVAVVGFHFINKAWNGRERDADILRLRRDLWWEGYDEAQWVVNNMRKHGLTVIWGGDYNRRLGAVPKFNARQQPVAADSIDGVYAARGRGTKAAKIVAGPIAKSVSINTPSDHPLVVGTVRLYVP